MAEDIRKQKQTFSSLSQDIKPVGRIQSSSSGSTSASRPCQEIKLPTEDQELEKESGTQKYKASHTNCL